VSSSELSGQKNFGPYKKLVISLTLTMRREESLLDVARNIGINPKFLGIMAYVVLSPLVV
jgi:hypothetical protein